MPTPACPGAVAMAAMVSELWLMLFPQAENNKGSIQEPLPGRFGHRSVLLAGHFCFDLAGNVPLLGNGQNIVHQPVQNQTCREPQEEDRKDQRHHLHDLGLHRIRRSRVQTHLQEHAGAHQNRQDEVRVLNIKKRKTLPYYQMVTANLLTAWVC